MKTYYYISGMYRGNEVTAIDADGKDHSIEKLDHNSKMVFESEREAQKYIDGLESPTDTNFRYQVEQWNPGTVFLIDSWNNHRVIGDFDSQEQIDEYLDRRADLDNWQDMAETFDLYADGFYIVEWSRMREAVRKYGLRKLQYWT